MKTPKIQELIDAGVHFGHPVKRWHPKMEPYIYTISKKVHIIDLEQTESLLKEANEFLYEVAKKGGKIVFVGTKKQARDIIELEAKRCGALYVKERWIGGTITNFETIKKNIDKLLSLIKGREDGNFDKYTKKERLMIDRDVEKLENVYGGIISMTDKPDALFVIDPKREKTAIKEAKSAKLPVVALVDTNSDPTNINYVVPGNDDAIKSIAIIVKSIADAVEEGYKDFGKGVEKAKVTVDAVDTSKDNKRTPEIEVPEKVIEQVEEKLNTEEETKEARSAVSELVEDEVLDSKDKKETKKEKKIPVTEKKSFVTKKKSADKKPAKKTKK